MTAILKNFLNNKHSLNLTSDMKRSSEVHGVICDVTRSQSWSKFKIAIAPSIFQSVTQKLQIPEMLMAILLVYSTSGIASGKKSCRDLKMTADLNILKY